MTKERIVIDLDKEICETLHSLRDNVLDDDGLVFFKMHTNSKQSWYRFIVSMGLVKVKQDFAKWKEKIEDND